MKKIYGLFLLLAIIVMMVSCITETKNQTKNQIQNIQQRNISLLIPLDIIEKKLSGSDNDGDYTFVFRENNILEYTLNGNTYFGNWKYDASSRILRYMINWDENGTEKGYGVDIIREESKILIYGYWYITDAMIRISKEVVIED